MFDVIFMDCNMPFKDGPTATTEIRLFISQRIKESGESYRQPMIFAVTGHVEEEYAKLAIESGMNEVINKPATVKKI